MNADKILFRCSSLGHIMTEGVGKTNFEKWEDACASYTKAKEDYALMKNKETITAKKKLAQIEKLFLLIEELDNVKYEKTLGESCKTHLVDKYVSAKYGRNTDISSKYTTKGLMVEEDSLTLYSRYKKQFFKKNVERFENEFISGLPDIDESQIIRDIKSSWDIFTFFRVNPEKLNKMYYWQLQGYMALTGATNSVLAYCLVNTPEILRNDEKRKLYYKMGVIDDTNPEYVAACEELDKNMIYDDIPIDERVKELVVERNDADIQRLYERVKDCREYMNTYLFKVETEVV